MINDYRILLQDVRNNLTTVLMETFAYAQYSTKLQVPFPRQRTMRPLSPLFGMNTATAAAVYGKKSLWVAEYERGLWLFKGQC